MLKRLLMIFCVVIVSTHVFSQNPPAYKKGTFYALWGWNRGLYSNSDIRFKGNDYDFTLRTVKAVDKQNPFSYHDYFQLDRITIPQTNFRFGYFIKDNIAITVGVDHMKYVMKQDQTVDIDGTVRPQFDDKINDGSIKLTEDFLTFEHTDGLNYVNTEIEFYKNFYNSKVLKVNGLFGGGGGILLPKTNAMLMGEERHDAFHVSGFGVNTKAGIDLLFWNIVFLRSELKQGYINMPDIRTTAIGSDKASQAFFFGEWTYMFGASWRF